MSACDGVGPDGRRQMEEVADAAACAQGCASGGLTRRKLLASAASAAAVWILTSCGPRRLRDFPPDRLRSAIHEMEERYRNQYGRSDVSLSDAPAARGVLFGYALDISRCIGCRRCVYACVEENNPSRDPQVQWIRVLEMDKEKGVDLSEADAYYDPEQVPQEGKFYVPVSCQQCENPPCTKVCPTGATWTEPEGIVVIDYDWCIGCRYCMAACPYGARHFNWAAPSIPSDELNPNMHVLGNRPRPKGVVEKCTFCIQRTRAGRYPACVEVCPVGARKFGNLLDPDSEIRYIIEHKRVLVLKEDLNTVPKFFYFYGT
ncbi:MAG: 4Fe-4S dicluster domain-containing protein [Candidatus Eisenbacteria bacterium]|nr:4Fe-4S dicluster domain-containing protein [Candidatus Eisenbacteria bacterium]